MPQNVVCQLVVSFSSLLQPTTCLARYTPSLFPKLYKDTQKIRIKWFSMCIRVVVLTSLSY